MKKLFYLSLSVLFINCVYTNPRTFNLTVTNQSGVPITVKSYLGHIQEQYTLSLPKNESILKTETLNEPESFDFANFFGDVTIECDSIEVLYNNEKIARFKNECDGLRNPLNKCVFTGFDKEFIFTVEDYENAEDCMGNCD